MEIYIDSRIIGSENVGKLESLFPGVSFITDSDKSGNAEIAVVMPNFFISRNMRDYSNLKFVQLLMAGYDKFDVDLASKLGIVVANAQDIFSIAVAEDVFTKIFVLNRNVRHYHEAMKQKIWEPIPREQELTGSVVGILGTGSIGRELAVRFKAFSTTVYGYGRKARQLVGFDRIFNNREGLEFIMTKSDYVVLALPLTEETRHLIDKHMLELMKSSALLINVARGEVVDQQALEAVLVQKRIRGAGIDVTDPEPLPTASKLWELDNVYLTPHNASSSPYMQERLTRLVKTNLENYLDKNDLLYVIN